MSGLEPHEPQQTIQAFAVGRPMNRQQRALARQRARDLAAVEHRAEVQAWVINAEAALGRERVHAVESVGKTALVAQAGISTYERLLIETEVNAITGVAFIGQRLTLALGEVVDRTVEGVLR